MEKASRGKKGRILIVLSLQLLQHHKRLFIYPLLGYLAKFLIYAAIITPFLHSRQQLLDQVNNLPAQQVVLLIVIFMILLFFINVVLFFFNTAMIANILHFIRYKKEARVYFGFLQAIKNYGRVFLWASYAGTAGIIFNLLPRSSQYRLKLKKLLRGNHWTVASFLSLSLIMDQKVNPITAMRESGRLVHNLWGENLHPNYSFFALLFWLRTPPLLVFACSALFATSHATLIIIGLIAGFLILLASSFYQMINTTIRVVSYCYAQYQLAPTPFSANIIHKLFTARIK